MTRWSFCFTMALITSIFALMDRADASLKYLKYNMGMKAYQQQQQQQKQQQAAMTKAQQEAMQKQAAAQAAEERRLRENHLRANRIRDEKEAKRKEEIIAKRKADAAAAPEVTTKPNAAKQ